MLRQLRRDRGMSIRTLAESADVNQANISRLETGVASRPHVASLTRIAVALGVEPRDLYVAAGVDVHHELPAFANYLRARYGWLSEDEIDQFDRLLARCAAASRVRHAESA